MNSMPEAIEFAIMRLDLNGNHIMHLSWYSPILDLRGDLKMQ